MSSGQEQINSEPVQENNKENTEMVGDDSNLVDEILNELNDNDNTNPSYKEPQNNEKVDITNVNQSELDNIPDIPNTVEIDYDSDENKTNKIISLLKKPVIVMCLSFIIFNPIIIGSLESCFPRIFQQTNTLMHTQLRTLLLSVIVAVLFLGTNLLF